MDAPERSAWAKLRLEHDGRWVAWWEDGRRIAAGGDDPESVRAPAALAERERTILEWVPAAPVHPVDSDR